MKRNGKNRTVRTVRKEATWVMKGKKHVRPPQLWRHIVLKWR